MDEQRIGRYTILGEIDRGGMAIVYRALDPQINREVAIKLMSQAFLHDPQLRKRFELEAQVIAGLENPAIVPVYDFGEDKEQPYLVMRLMTGGSLSARLAKSGPLPPEEVSRILQRIAMALDTAHNKGLIHRDLKPANILFDQSGEPYLTDFGIVKVVEGSSTALTVTGGLIGTPAYMSPEQVLGQKLDKRSDIYSLGIMTYEMLSGQQPYRATTPIAQAFMHVNEPTPRLVGLDSDQAISFQRVVDKAMAKDRDERFDSAQLMSDTFKNALTDETRIEPVPPIPPPPSPRDKIPIWAWVSAGVAAVILAIILLVNVLPNYALPKTEPTAVVIMVPASPTAVEHIIVNTATPPQMQAPTPVPAISTTVEEVLEETIVTEPPPTDTPRPRDTPTPTPNPTPLRVSASRPSNENWNRYDSIWASTNPKFQDMDRPATRYYDVTVDPSDVLRWSFAWCATDTPTLNNILAPLTVEMLIDGNQIPDSKILKHNVSDASGWECRYLSTVLSDWQREELVALEISYNLTESIFDGEASYAPGEHGHIIRAKVR